ncbi:hypothetical protein [Streptomyces sp. NPDC019890]|uniref:hypothetical protein n=1 Tax=Streptomyces sp. NPDC019890 TaxID=3365064 RepID=UPI00384EEA27
MSGPDTASEAYQAFIARFQVEPTPAQWAFWLRDAYGITTGAGSPLSQEQVQPLLQVLQERYAVRAEEPVASDEPQATDQPADQWYDYFYSAWRTYERERGAYPDAAALAAYVYERDTITGDGGRPITGDDLADLVTSFQEREFGDAEPPADGAAADPGERTADELLAQEQVPEAALAGAGAQAAKDKRSPRVNAAIDDSSPGPQGSTGERTALTTVDRYHLAWMDYQTERGNEPTAEQLSAYLAAKGMHGRGGRPVSPANLRRYFLPSRVYNVWAEHRMRDEEPAADALRRSAQPAESPPSTTSPSPPSTSPRTSTTSSDAGRLSPATTPTRSSKPANAHRLRIGHPIRPHSLRNQQKPLIIPALRRQRDHCAAPAQRASTHCSALAPDDEEDPMRALRIDPDATVTDINLPEPDAHSAIRNTWDPPTPSTRGAYHQRAVLHIHGSGRTLALPQNLAAWALASVWRGMALYPLAGPIVVTGRTATGDVATLEDDLAQHAKAVAQTVRDTLTEWRTRPPASNEAAISELLAYASRAVASSR